MTAEGALIVDRDQLQYEQLLFGHNTGIKVESIEGLEDVPDLRTDDRARLIRHGEHVGLDLLGGRTVTAKLHVTGDSDAEFRALLDAVMDNLQPSLDTPKALAYTLRSMDTTRKMVWARVRRRSYMLEHPHYAARHAEVLVEWRCNDPLIYDAIETFDDVRLGTAGGGLPFPLTFPLDFGGAESGLSMPLTMPLDLQGIGASGSLVVENKGNWPAPWVVRFDGPVDSPGIYSVTADKLVKVNVTLEADDFLEIDSRDPRTVLLNGTASRYGSLDAATQWFDLAPGSNVLQFQGGTTQQPQMTVTFRSAWI